MENEKFLGLEKIADDIHDKFTELYDKGELKEIQDKIQSVLGSLSERFNVDLNLDFSIYDSETNKSIEIYKIGITGSGGNSGMYVHSEGYKLNRYLCNGNIIELPHIYCPNCWGEWDFKGINDSCPECGVKIGKEVKLLLDSNECPNCEDGEVSQMNPECSKCSFVANDDIVIWG